MQTNVTLFFAPTIKNKRENLYTNSVLLGYVSYQQKEEIYSCFEATP